MDATRLTQSRLSQPRITLLGVWAHPDDEAYLAGGLMARVAAAGGRVVTTFATRGEAAFGSADPALARLRNQEATEALRRVGAEPPRFLGYEDGACDAAEPAVARRAVARVLDEVRPDLVVTFGEDGITGHPDHRAVSSWALAACARAGVEAWLPALDVPFLTRYGTLHRTLGLFGDHIPRVTGPDDIVARLELDEHELDRKRSMLAAHDSQTAGLARQVGEEVYRHWWDVERFRRPEALELALAA